MKKILGLFLFIFSFLLAGLATSHAVVSCQPIYGGGQSCVTTDLAVRKTVTDPASPLALPGQVVTKGGLPVLPPPKVAVTPPTGPELLPLIGLLPAGIGGWFLRRNSGGKKTL